MLKALDKWLLPYLMRRRGDGRRGRHLVLTVCDHYEPLHDTGKDGALKRVVNWRQRIEDCIEPFRDADGIRPRHTFFYPVEQYEPDLVGEIAELCRVSGNEAEIHLHHHDSTGAQLEHDLAEGASDLARHGFLGTDASGARRYGFIHGNWALANSHPSGRKCGVDNELAILRATGCYADFTMPSAPDPTQTRMINRIYYAGHLEQRAAHRKGDRASAATRSFRERDDRLLLVQGPLGLNWSWRKWGVMPRVENADVTGANPPTISRFGVWRNLAIHVAGKPEWLFVKLHTHGALPRNSNVILGEPMKRFHAALREQSRTAGGIKTHYASAREMVNMIHAAEDGRDGDPGDFRDYVYARPPIMNGG